MRGIRSGTGTGTDEFTLSAQCQDGVKSSKIFLCIAKQ